MAASKERIKNMLQIIDDAKEGEGWWIDDNFHFKICGDSYELMKHCNYFSKAGLKKVAKEILNTGDYKG